MSNDEIDVPFWWVQAWRVAHPPVRGHSFCGTRPMVHVGFMKSWLAGGFNEKVITRVMELVQSQKADAKLLTVYITGWLHCLTLSCSAILCVLHCLSLCQRFALYCSTRSADKNFQLCCCWDISVTNKRQVTVRLPELSVTEK